MNLFRSRTPSDKNQGLLFATPPVSSPVLRARAVALASSCQAGTGDPRLPSRSATRFAGTP